MFPKNRMTMGGQGRVYSWELIKIYFEEKNNK